MITEPESPTAADLPLHMVSLGDADWSAWRWIVLRSAGFPADLVLTLAAPEAAAMADSLVRAEDEAQRAVHLVLDVRRQAMQDPDADRGTMNRIKRQVLKGRAVDAASIAHASVRAAAETYNAALADVLALRDAYRRAYAATDAALDRAIYDLVESSLFREALIWQNRQMYRRVIARLRDRAASRPPIREEDRRLVASYVQRYCVKNDTIGFFGPVAWMRVSPDRPRLTVRPGANLLAARSVLFETWCIDAVCTTLSEDQALLHCVEPRPRYLRVDRASMRVFYPGRREPTQLDATQMIVLLACDGERTAERFVGELLPSHPALFPDAASVYAQLAALRELGAIAWALSVPIGPRPEVDLRAQLQQVPDEGLRQNALAVVAELEQEREQVAAAAGNPDALEAALDRLDQTFTRLTGAEPTRRAGQTYAGRTLVYEDCRRDLDVEMGADVLHELGRPLSLLLTSARWLSGEMVRRCRKEFAATYATLASQSDSSEVDAAAFWSSLWPLVQRIEAQIAEDFGQRWRAILGPTIAQQCDNDGAPRRVQLRSDDIRDQVEQTFGCRRPAWQQAWYHSPDIMIAAEGSEAIRRGDYFFVLGELHIAKNTLDSTTFLDQHPAPHEIGEALAADLCRPRVIIPRQRTRGFRGSHLPTDYWLESDARSGCPRSQALPLARLSFDLEGGVVVARMPGGGATFELTDLLAAEMAFMIVNTFQKVLAGAPHHPRLAIDRLVVHRERWCVPVSELRWAHEGDDSARFLGARRWARERRMPRFVFVKSIVEAKPFYVDFDSPIYVTLLAKTVLRSLERRPDGAEIVLTEMLPTHDQTWVPDGEGHRYASELRIATYDCEGRVASGVGRAMLALS